MSAPGNSALIFALLALFLACSGYAAGRVHQRNRTDEDREEAYRHGYDTASRSVFTLAARIIAPRRSAGRDAVSGSARVRSGLGELTTRSLQALRVTSVKPAVVAAIATPELPSDLGIFAQVAGAGDAGVVGSGVAWSGASSPAASLPGSPSRVPLAVELGFPVPPPPSPNTVAEPAAVGGVTFQPFPHPRPAEDFGPVPAFADDEGTAPARSVPSPRSDKNAGDGDPVSAVGHRAADGEPAPDPDAPGGHHPDLGSVGGRHPDLDSPGGRHTVPDELVRAATYRLPPDRVFRAKVRDTATPEDPAARRSVPKPRQS